MILIFKNKSISDQATEKTIQILQKKLLEQDMQSDAVSFDDIELYIDNSGVTAIIAGKNLMEYSTVFFRRVGEFRNLAHIVALLAKKNGITFFDNLYVVTNEPGKLKQTVVLALNGVPVPKTYFAGRYDMKNIENASKYLGFPIVAKISKSRKGKGIYLAKNKKELEDITKENVKEEILLQSFIPNDFDYRILVLGDEVACVEKRIRKDKNEFRNNVSLGATEEFVSINSISKYILDLAVDAAKKADIQVAGVDVVVDPSGKAFIFEVNRAPAFTHDDTISNELNKLVEFLKKCEQKIS